MFRKSILILASVSLSFIALSAPVAASGDPVIAAVGDMACPPNGKVTATTCQQNAVGDLVRDNNPDRFLAMGDTQYNKGELSNYQASYDKAFGSLLPITEPVPGNHEYMTPGAAGYKAYFNVTGTTYYSYNVGAWHLIALDSDCKAVGGCALKSKQYAWLKADLAANPTACTLAYMHHPRWAAGEHGDTTVVKAMWALLYKEHADVVLAGHEHSYQRFELTSSTGPAADGIRSWIVGTGGKSQYQSTEIHPYSQFTDRSHFGALFLTLHPTSYDWVFRTTAGQVLDSGSEACR